MIPNWSPEAWNSFGVVGLMVCGGAFLLVALVRGWIVFGPHHREIVAGYQREAENKDARAVKDADTINTLSRAITEKNATEDATTRILAAFREAAAVGEH